MAGKNPIVEDGWLSRDFKTITSAAKVEDIEALLYPSVTDPNFKTLLSKTVPKVDNDTWDPGVCIRGDLIEKLVESKRQTFSGIVACRRYTALKKADMNIVSIMKWTAETIAYALQRTAVEPINKDFASASFFKEYQHLANSDVSMFSGNQFRDESGATFRTIEGKTHHVYDVLDEFEESGSPDWVRDSYIKMTFTDGEIARYKHFKDLDRGIQVVVHTFDGDDTINDVWVVCDSSLKEYARVAKVFMHWTNNEIGHAVLADLRDPAHVKMWDPNYTGLQSLAAAHAKDDDCVDEKRGGWCQTWSLFYLEETLLKPDSSEPLLSNFLKVMFRAWHETPAEQRPPELVSVIGGFRVLFGDGEESPWCALTNFVRKLATRYMKFQESVRNLYVERLAARNRIKQEYSSRSTGVT